MINVSVICQKLFDYNYAIKHKDDLTKKARLDEIKQKISEILIELLEACPNYNIVFNNKPIGLIPIILFGLFDKYILSLMGIAQREHLERAIRNAYASVSSQSIEDNALYATKFSKYIKVEKVLDYKQPLFIANAPRYNVNNLEIYTITEDIMPKRDTLFILDQNESICLIFMLGNLKYYIKLTEYLGEQDLQKTHEISQIIWYFLCLYANLEHINNLFNMEFFLNHKTLNRVLQNIVNGYLKHKKSVFKESSNNAIVRSVLAKHLTGNFLSGDNGMPSGAAASGAAASGGYRSKHRNNKKSLNKNKNKNKQKLKTRKIRKTRKQ
jgi:hypothetical protein